MTFAETWMDLETIILSEVKSERQIPYDITDMWNIKQDTNVLIYKTNRLMVAKGEEEWGRVELGVQDQQMQTIIYRMDKQQGPTLQYREQYSIPCDKP